MEANRLPATTDEEKYIKKENLDNENKYAIQIPLETAKKCLRVIELSEELVTNGNPNSVSDAGVAAEVALAGIRGACLNVMINLAEIDDTSYCGALQNEVDSLIKNGESIHKTVFEKTVSIIKG